MEIGDKHLQFWSAKNEIETLSLLDNSLVQNYIRELSANLDIFYRKNVMLALDPIVHESYKSPNVNSNDIALLKLAEDVDLNTYTPACLAASGADYTGQNGRVYGNSLKKEYLKINLKYEQVGEAQRPVLLQHQTFFWRWNSFYEFYIISLY